MPASRAASNSRVTSEMNKISGDSQSTVRGTIFNNAFQIQVVDQFGNGVEGVTVHWSSLGPADLLTATAPTDVFGFGRGYLTAHDTLGFVSITATIAGLAGSPITFTGSIVGATSIVKVQNNFFEPDSIHVQVGGAVQWQFIGSGHTVTATSVEPACMAVA